MQKDGFWNDQEKAKNVSKKRLLASTKKTKFLELQSDVEDLSEFIEIIEEGTDEYEEIEKNIIKLEKNINAFETELLLSGQYDQMDCYLNLHAGTGGVDAMDWTGMLLRMYTRFFDEQKWKYSIIEKVSGEEAGLKSVMIEVEGMYVYGKMKCEHGVHRLVRSSPFNSKGLRQTSFALVEVMPKLDLEHSIEVQESDLRIDTFRAQGAGGQHVNTTDSAVRITHIPTGIVVQCQNERSQLQNKTTAIKMLESKLVQQKIEQNKETVAEIRGENKQASWGNQIRSYVFCPYTLVKDHRTNYETAQVQDVMDGDLEGFIEAKLRR